MWVGRAAASLASFVGAASLRCSSSMSMIQINTYICVYIMKRRVEHFLHGVSIRDRFR